MTVSDEARTTQADREAAASYYAKSSGRGGSEEVHAGILRGAADNSTLVQAFARHASQARAEMREEAAKVADADAETSPIARSIANQIRSISATRKGGEG